MSERDLSTFTCPEGQEAYAIPGSGILAATSEDGKVDGEGIPDAARCSGRENGGQKLPLEPDRHHKTSLRI